MSVKATPIHGNGAMTAQEYFCEASTSFHDFPDRNTALNIVQAGGAVWNCKDEMPSNMTAEVSDLIGNALDIDNWVRDGRRYSIAARHILPRVKAEYQIVEAAKAMEKVQ